jgi:hypothetical protein
LASENNNLSLVDNLVRTLIILGVVLIGSIIIAKPDSGLLQAAGVTLVMGLLSFTLSAQFIVTLHIEGPSAEKPKIMDGRLTGAFIGGYLAYLAAAVLICIHFLLA